MMNVVLIKKECEEGFEPPISRLANWRLKPLGYSHKRDGSQVAMALSLTPNPKLQTDSAQTAGLEPATVGFGDQCSPS
jgi:hypothetical protein